MGRVSRLMSAGFACGLFAACGLGQSRLNPVNWFGDSGDERIAAWIGQNADFLVDELGKPRRVTETEGGGRELTYHDGSTETGADARCLALFRIDPFNVVSAGQVFVDKGACKALIKPPR